MWDDVQRGWLSKTDVRILSNWWVNFAFYAIYGCLRAGTSSSTSRTDQTTITEKSSQLQCPSGSSRIGQHNADIAGCGLESCDVRYLSDRNTPESCREHCLKNSIWDWLCSETYMAFSENHFDKNKKILALLVSLHVKRLVLHQFLVINIMHRRLFVQFMIQQHQQVVGVQIKSCAESPVCGLIWCVYDHFFRFIFSKMQIDWCVQAILSKSVIIIMTFGDVD